VNLAYLFGIFAAAATHKQSVRAAAHVQEMMIRVWWRCPKLTTRVPSSTPYFALTLQTSFLVLLHWFFVSHLVGSWKRTD
jgi:hypothetical protein